MQQLACENEINPTNLPLKSKSSRKQSDHASSASAPNQASPLLQLKSNNNSSAQDNKHNNSSSIPNQQNVFLDVVDAFQNYIGNKLSMECGSIKNKVTKKEFIFLYVFLRYFNVCGEFGFPLT